jgi:hypothetical protein
MYSKNNMEFTEMKLRKSIFERIFELIGPYIDSFIINKRKIEVLNIPNLLDEIKNIEIEVDEDMEYTNAGQDIEKDKNELIKIYILI